MEQFPTTFFNAGMFGPQPKTKRPFRTLPPGVKYSDNLENFYETKEGDAIRPKIHLVFDRLHELCEWTKVPEIKKTNYTIWKNQLILANNGDGRLIHETLRKVIKDYHLNPSERKAQNEDDYCKAPTCVYDVGSGNCRKPTLEDYARLKFDSLGIRFSDVPTGQYKLFEQSVKNEFERAKKQGTSEYADLCRKMRFLGASKKQPDFSSDEYQQFNMKPLQNNAALDNIIRSLQNGVPFFQAIQNKPLTKPTYAFMRT